MIIGLSGKISSGKDTVGKIIQSITQGDRLEKVAEIVQNDWVGSEPVYEIRKFAAKLKQVASLLTGIPVEDFERQEVKDRVLGEEWGISEIELDYTQTPNVSVTDTVRMMTVRELLQRVGTEAMRDNVHEDVWVNALFADYKPTYNIKHSITVDTAPNWIITDVRFPNEADAIKKRGGLVVRVERYNLDGSDYGWGNPASDHPSETSLDDYDFDYRILNNGTIDDLVLRVKEFLTKFNIN